MLGELNSKVEASTREVSQLQAKLEQAHTRILEEKAQRNKIQEEHLKGVIIMFLLLLLLLFVFSA